MHELGYFIATFLLGVLAGITFIAFLAGVFDNYNK